jgi:hypothetical protein
MLTGETLAEAGRSCRDRFGARFQGFDLQPWELAAHQKFAEFLADDITRRQLNEWLIGQVKQTAIRGLFNRLRV